MVGGAVGAVVVTSVLVVCAAGQPGAYVVRTLFASGKVRLGMQESADGMIEGQRLRKLLLLYIHR